MAAGAIAMNAGDAFICAGVESMSRVPMGGYNPLPSPSLHKRCPDAYISMGETAENLAARYGITREAQDAFALESQAKAAAAIEAGKLDGEIVPVGNITRDGCPRPGTSREDLSSLKPAFDETGTVTAATSSPLTDGAAATLICSEDYATAKGLAPIARIKSIAVAGCAPEIMGIGPVPATRKALARAGLTIGDIDVTELNEAFAAQALACIHDLELDPATVNLDGGAIAFGHPLGATGARITGKAAILLAREGGRYALATQCIGGGQGIAIILEAAL
jgi:acetyl-CoA acyltransferase